MRLKAAYYHALADIFLMLHEICGLGLSAAMAIFWRFIGSSCLAACGLELMEELE